MKFLSAKWSHLLLANYRVEPELLLPFVPGGTKVDQFEGQTYVSLVAFGFEQTRILGIPVPYHCNFAEVNLRFYITPDKDPSIRAVTFVQEIVPRRLIPLVANSLFRENYVSMPIKHVWELDQPGKRFLYSWGKQHQHRFSAQIDSPPSLPATGSIAEFITEHYWGYSQARRSTLEYRVEHPQWNCCELENYEIVVDFAELYGDTFAFLNQQKPDSVQYAEGSAVTVSFPARLKTK